MSRAELLAALGRDGDARLQQLRERARAAEAELRAVTGRRAVELRAAAEARWAEEARRAAERCRRTAERQVRSLALQAESALAGRLWALGLELLAEGAEADPGLFSACCAELPERSWTEVRVHPRDAARAAERFPAAVVAVDAQLIGGVVASDDGGKVRCDNSLRCRLRHGWDDLLPLLLADLEGDDDDAAASP